MQCTRCAGWLLVAALLLAGPRPGRAEASSPEELASLREYLEVLAAVHDRSAERVSYQSLQWLARARAAAAASEQEEQT